MSTCVEGMHRIPRALTIVLIAALVLLVLRLFVVTPFRVEQDSMLPALHPQDVLLVESASAAIRPYGPGDIVIVRGAWADQTGTLVKRVVAVGPGTVELRGGTVLFEGRRIDERAYLAPAVRTRGVSGERSWELSEDQVFLLGDNRDVSSDSRSFGPVAVEDIVGRATLTLP